MAKVAKTADRKKVMDTTKSTDCPKCGKPTRVVKRVKDRERDIPGGMYISCSACDFYEKLDSSRITPQGSNYQGRPVFGEAFLLLSVGWDWARP